MKKSKAYLEMPGVWEVAEIETGGYIGQDTLVIEYVKHAATVRELIAHARGLLTATAISMPNYAGVTRKVLADIEAGLIDEKS